MFGQPAAGRPKRCSGTQRAAIGCPSTIITERLSMQQIWTALQHDGPNHLDHHHRTANRRVRSLRAAACEALSRGHMRPLEASASGNVDGAIRRAMRAIAVVLCNKCAQHTATRHTHTQHTAHNNTHTAAHTGTWRHTHSSTETQARRQSTHEHEIELTKSYLL